MALVAGGSSAAAQTTIAGRCGMSFAIGGNRSDPGQPTFDLQGFRGRWRGIGRGGLIAGTFTRSIHATDDTRVPIPVKGLPSTATAIHGAGAVFDALAVSHALASACVGLGSMSEALIRGRGLFLAAFGAGSLTENLKIAHTLSATLSGHATATPASRVAHTLLVSAHGVGAFVAHASIALPIHATFAGIGSVSDALAVRHALVANLHGQGTAFGALFAHRNLSSTMSGRGFIVASEHPPVPYLVDVPFVGVVVDTSPNGTVVTIGPLGTIAPLALSGSIRKV